jgi:hypothetical protein
MIGSFFVALFLGALAGNVFPHFVNGITKKDYPSAFGNGPVVNFVLGWLGVNLTVALVWWAWPMLLYTPLVAAAGASLGLLLIGLFHAGPGAFGRSRA